MEMSMVRHVDYLNKIPYLGDSSLMLIKWEYSNMSQVSVVHATLPLMSSIYICRYIDILFSMLFLS